MISLSIRGGNRFQKHIANVTITWCCKKMMPRLRKLDLHLHIRDIKDADGYCLNDSTDEVDFSGMSPRRFMIEVQRNLSLTDFISTIIHEMEHVRQYVMLELRDMNSHVKWKTKKYRHDFTYEDQPWEKMAYAKQEKYLLECLSEAVFILDPDTNGFQK